MGITFNVYDDEAGTERIFPFDLIPRIVEAADWAIIERGLKQRIQALNLFIDDVYADNKVIYAYVPKIIRYYLALSRIILKVAIFLRHL